jgi:hypothetical protein
MLNVLYPHSIHILFASYGALGITLLKASHRHKARFGLWKVSLVALAAIYTSFYVEVALDKYFVKPALPIAALMDMSI